MPELFDRRAAVTVAEPVSGSYTATRPNAIRVEDLRVAFRVEKTRSKDPNTCEVMISNLSERTRKQFETKGLKLILEAGYKDTMRQVFSGDIIWGRSKREGVNWTTTLHGGDGARAFQHARVNQSKQGSVNIGELVQKTAEQFGIKPGNSKRIAQIFSSKKVGRRHGHSARGSAAAHLTKLLDLEGYEWSIQDGELQILQPGESLPGVSLEISSDTGMIGVPEWNTPDTSNKSKKDRRPFITVRTLLAPELRPGSRFRLFSQAVYADFTVRKIQHVGDTHGADWYSEIEGLPL